MIIRVRERQRDRHSMIERVRETERQTQYDRKSENYLVM